ncbi:hypothetical protein [uncultured Pseudokineococcus sp.]|uniref:hypothetical protein n=1 Tax=uncultured Pseudokineococcus sp. TaxID=1642928 RepID=UPI0026387BE9|nr:hypothetical protein [uncultured Pseudokineococcus sp.]
MTEPTEPGDLLPPATAEDVFAVAEEVRAADFAGVPAALVADVLAAERDNLDNRTDAARTVDQVIEEYLLSEHALAGEEPTQ